MDTQNHLNNKQETVISIHGLYKSFGELDVLKGIDIDVFKGENVAVLGKSGSGKSVLIKIIVCLQCINHIIRRIQFFDAECITVFYRSGFGSSAIYNDDFISD